jgi:hypothetical protein
MITTLLFLIGLGMAPFALGEGEGVDRIRGNRHHGAAVSMSRVRAACMAAPLPA